MPTEKKVHFETDKKTYKPIQQPAFIIGLYRTSPLKALDIPPIPKWKNPYAHIKAKVNSH
jgi:hypothetical protein